MTPQEIIDYSLKKEGSSLEFPFGEIPLVVKAYGRIFLELYPREGNYKVTLKCEPFLAELYRGKYPGIVIPGYHVPNRQKKYWNTVMLLGEIEDGEVLSMIDHSYHEAITKKKRKYTGPGL